MTAKQAFGQYQSYLLRLWQVKAADGTATWQGEIESIQSGQKWQFDSLEVMVNLLRTLSVGPGSLN